MLTTLRNYFRSPKFDPSPHRRVAHPLSTKMSEFDRNTESNILFPDLDDQLRFLLLFDFVKRVFTMLDTSKEDSHTLDDSHLLSDFSEVELDVDLIDEENENKDVDFVPFYDVDEEEEGDEDEESRV